MRIVGEVVTIITRKGGGVDDDGYPLPETIIRVGIPGAVVTPERMGVITADDRAGEYREMSVLLPRFEELGLGAEIEIRGEIFKIDRPPFHHRSVFGTSRGGTEIYVRRATG